MAVPALATAPTATIRVSSRARAPRASAASSSRGASPTTPSSPVMMKASSSARASASSGPCGTSKVRPRSRTRLRAIESDTARSAKQHAVDTDLEVPEWHSRSLIEDGRAFTETFPVRFDEVGPNKKTTMRTIASMLQECACNHAQGIWGRSQAMPADMKAQNLGWVCTRLHIVVDEYPAWGDMVEVRTWFDSQGKIAARRDWDMYYCTGDEEPNEQCASVGRATSQWVAFNIAKRKLARIPATVIPQFREQALKNTPVMGDDYDPDKLPDVREMSGAIAPTTQSVRRNDLDMNGHVNNVVYTEWLLEAVPHYMWNEFELTELVLEFREECGYGDLVDAVSANEKRVRTEFGQENAGVSMAHMLLRKSKGGSGDGAPTEVVRARTVWKARPRSPDLPAPAR